MAFLGLLLLVVAAVVIVAGVFGTDYDTVEGKNQLTTEFLGINCGPEVIFLIGVGGGVLAMLGIWFIKWGAQRGLRHRKEQKQLNELHDKLQDADRAEGKDGNN